MTSLFWGEFFGTLILILLGDGVVANVLLAKNKGQNSGWIVITAGWAFAVVIGVYVAQAFGSGSAFLNPAVAIGFSVLSGDYAPLATAIPAEFLGAFVGAVLVWLAHLDHWAPTEDKGLKLAVFCTGPAIRNLPANFLTEVIGTFVLILGCGALGSKLVAPVGIAPGLTPYLVGILVWAIGLSLGGPTGYAINPARDFAPRLAHAILPIPGKGSSDWGYSLVPVFGPIVGGILAALLLYTIK